MSSKKDLFKRYDINDYPNMPEILIKYVELLRPCTDGPTSFIIGSFLAIISSLASNSFILPHGILLNDYFLLIGASSITRKTTIQSFAVDFMRDVVGRLGNVSGEIDTTPQKQKNKVYQKVYAYNIVTQGTVEGLATVLNGSGKTILLSLEEFKIILDISARQSTANTITRLTSMYDNKEIFEALRGNGVTSAKDYTLSVLGCSTENWLRKFFSKVNIAGGFANRHLAFSGEPSDEPLGNPARPNKEKWDALVDEVASLFPRVTFTSSEETHGFEKKKVMLTISELGKGIMDGFTGNHFKKMKELGEHYSELTGREITHTWKLAGLHTILNRKTEIDSDSLLFANAIAEASSDCLLNLSKQPNQPTPDYREQLIQLIERGPISKRDIARHFGGPQGPINETLELLASEGEIIKDTETGLWERLHWAEEGEENDK